MAASIAGWKGPMGTTSAKRRRPQLAGIHQGDVPLQAACRIHSHEGSAVESVVRHVHAVPLRNGPKTAKSQATAAWATRGSYDRLIRR